MTEPLAVWYRNKLVGTLLPTDSQLMNFAYVAEWSAGELSFPISVSLPLDGSFSLTASHRFFANLLPEGNVRQQICRALGVHPENDFAILKAIGGDCAGALTITSESELESDTETSNERAYEEISDDQLAAWSVGSPDAFAAVTGRNEVRLSLAGAQDKLPVAVQGEAAAAVEAFPQYSPAEIWFSILFASPGERSLCDHAGSRYWSACG